MTPASSSGRTPVFDAGNVRSNRAAGTPRLVGEHPRIFDRDATGTRVVFEQADMRIIHAQRARKLRKRGEFVLPISRTTNGRRVFAWFVRGPGPLSLDVPA